MTDQIMELLRELRDAADLAFASADVAPEHTIAYDEVSARVGVLLNDCD
jgi:hypothetical protein